MHSPPFLKEDRTFQEGIGEGIKKLFKMERNPPPKKGKSKKGKMENL